MCLTWITAKRMGEDRGSKNLRTLSNVTEVTMIIQTKPIVWETWSFFEALRN